MFVPLLSEKDPAETAEGSLDPLGLYAISDSLSVRLVPGVRERQTHPRFLTAIAVSSKVCEGLEDYVPKDGISEAWQVFEWYAVTGLVWSRREDKEALRGLPGREKVAKAIAEDVPVSASRYLVNPSVFGFHGVYRRLAREIGILTEVGLGEKGHELIKTWSEEQSLPGFVGSAGGIGADWLHKLRDAVRAGLEEGKVAKSRTWDGMKFFGEHLAPYEFGPREKQLITRSLLATEGKSRGEILNFLVSREGRRIWQDADYSEREFHVELARNCSATLASLLKAILAYEEFARLLQDAFDDCLQLMAGAKGKVWPKDCAERRFVALAAGKASKQYSALIDKLEPFDESNRFRDAFKDLGEPLSAEEWATRLLEHHRRVQAAKPPNGKTAWFDRFDDGGCIVRAAYADRPKPAGEGKYVHGYRTRPLWSFASDLGMVGRNG